MTPTEYFQAGQLTEAIRVATEAVRDRPNDVTARSLFCELLCFAGDLERADKQLDTITSLDTDAAQGVSLMRHLIRSEYTRREVFEQGRVPAFLEEPGDSVRKRLEALLCLREGNVAGAQTLLQEAEESEPELHGTLNNNPFTGFRDLDDLLGPVMEIYTATGKYFWIHCRDIVSLELSPVEHLSDMLWRAGRIQTTGDVTGRVHVPVLYHQSAASEDERIRIGRATDWIQHGDDGQLITGCGHREFLVGDEPVTLLEINELTFAESGAA